MLAEMYSRMNGLTTKYAEAQVSTVRAVANTSNLLSLGALSPVTEMVNAWCDLYMEGWHRAEQGWLSNFPTIQFVNLNETMKTQSSEVQSAAEQHVAPANASSMSSIRDTADSSRQSIIDNDALWEPSFGTNSKSAHKYDSQQRERIREVDLP